MTQATEADRDKIKRLHRERARLIELAHSRDFRDRYRRGRPRLLERFLESWQRRNRRGRV